MRHSAETVKCHADNRRKQECFSQPPVRGATTLKLHAIILFHFRPTETILPATKDGERSKQNNCLAVAQGQANEIPKFMAMHAVTK